MGKITSIDAVERTVERDPELAFHEVRNCLVAMNASMEVLAKMFPGATCIAGFVRGQPCLTLASARAMDGDHFVASAMDAAKGLAEIIVSLLPELQDRFWIELNLAREIRRIKAEMEEVAAATIKAAHEGTGST